MKLKNLLEQRGTLEPRQPLEEKKEALATSPHTNITMHYDHDFKQVGESGHPEASFTISMSSTGGKEFVRPASDTEESAKISEGVRLELRRAMRKFDKHVQAILQKYSFQPKI